MAAVQLGDIGIVPGDDLDQPEYTYKALVDFGVPVKKSVRLFNSVCLLLTALLNKVGGILILSNKPGTSCLPKDLDDWQMSLGGKLSAFIPERETLVKMELTRIDGTNAQLMLFIKKSADFITFDSFMFVNDGPQRTKTTNTRTISRILAQTTTQSNLNLPLRNGRVTYDQVMPDESEELEYKLWNVSTLAEYQTNLSKEAYSKSLFSMPNRSGGGKLVIGVEDGTNKVKGQVLSEKDESDLTNFIQGFLTMDNNDWTIRRIWGCENIIPQKGIHWDVEYVPVDQAPGHDRWVLIVITMPQCEGGVFQKCPLSYVVKDDASLRCLTFVEWRERCLKHGSLTSDRNRFQQGPTARQPGGATSLPTLPPIGRLSLGTGKIRFNKEMVNAELRRKSKLSWTESNLDWRQAIQIKARHLDTDVALLATESRVFEPKIPLNFSPSESFLTRAFPDIKTALDQIKLVCHEAGCVFAHDMILSCFKGALSIPKVAHHVVELLVIQSNTVHLWLVVRELGDRACARLQNSYLYRTGRAVKRHLVETLFEQRNHIPAPLICHKYSLADQRTVMENILPDHLTETLPYECCILALSHLLLQKKTHIKRSIDSDIDLRLSAKQLKITLDGITARVSYIVGPPGVGKTIVGFTMCKFFDAEEVLYIVSTPEFREYVKHQRICKTALVNHEQDIQALIDDRKLDGIRCLIFDDIQTMRIKPPAWGCILDHIKMNVDVKMLLLADHAVQNYMTDNCAASLKQHVKSFCKKENISFASSALTVVHRNSQMITAYIQKCSNTSEPLGCTSELEGLDVEILFMSTALEDSVHNPLIECIKDLTASATKGVQFDYRDIVILIPQSDVERIGVIRRLLLKYLGQDSVHQSRTFPITGIRILSLGSFHGMESGICINIIKDSILTQQPKLKAFIASRAIHKLLFVVTPDRIDAPLAAGLDADLVQGLGCHDLSRLQASAAVTQAADTPGSDKAIDDKDGVSPKVSRDPAENTGDDNVEPHSSDNSSSPGHSSASASAAAADDDTENNPKAIAAALKGLVEQQGSRDAMAELLEKMRAQAKQASDDRDHPHLATLGCYLPVMLQLLAVAEGQLPVDILRQAWLICVYLTREDTNRALYVSSGGVERGFTALSTYTNADVICFIVATTVYIAVSHPAEIIKPPYIARLLALLGHDDHDISYMSCQVLKFLIIYGSPLSAWPGVHGKHVTSQMTAAVARWRLEEDTVGTVTHITGYKDMLTHDNEAVQCYHAWVLANYVTTDPTTYCPLVVRDIGTDYIQTVLTDARCCTQAAGLLQTVLGICLNK